MINNFFNALSRSRSKFLKIFNILSKDISEDEIDTIEELLIETDIGYDAVESIIDIISANRKNKSDLVNAIKSPLGDHTGVPYKPLPKEILLTFEPSLFITYICW